MEPARDWSISAILASVLIGIGWFAKQLIEGRIDKMTSADAAQNESNRLLAKAIGDHMDVLKTMTESVRKTIELDQENRERHDSTMILIRVIARKMAVSDGDIEAEEERQKIRRDARSPRRRYSLPRHHPKEDNPNEHHP